MAQSATMPRASRTRLATITGLDALVGAHPSALRMIFERGEVADPNELGASVRGRLLAIEKGAAMHLAIRPVVRLLAADWSPWRGKSFDHGGNSGLNRVYSMTTARFVVEKGDSLIDQKPTLVLSYDAPHLGNSWPISALRDELRLVAPGVAIGPVFYGARSSQPIFWFGLTNKS